MPSAERFLPSGALAGATSALIFTALHHLLISNIWFSLPLMLVAGAICGLCLAWSYGLLFQRASAASWLLYNLVYMVLFVLLGVSSLLVYEPVTSVAALMAANEPPRELIRRAMPLTLGCTLVAAALLSLLWGRSWRSFGAILLTCTILMLLLGLNVSVLGLVRLSSGEAYLVAELFALILALNLGYVAVFLLLQREALLRLWPAPTTADERDV